MLRAALALLPLLCIMNIAARWDIQAESCPHHINSWVVHRLAPTGMPVSNMTHGGPSTARTRRACMHKQKRNHLQHTKTCVKVTQSSLTTLAAALVTSQQLCTLNTPKIPALPNNGRLQSLLQLQLPQLQPAGHAGATPVLLVWHLAPRFAVPTPVPVTLLAQRHAVSVV